MKGLDEMSSRKRKYTECKVEENDSKKIKVEPEQDPTFIWTWTDEAIYFVAPIQTPLNFTPLLPEATIKIDFDLKVTIRK